ncbi:MAG: hypothetical protein ACYC7J_13485 [Syntrophales bacterium]
MIREIGNLPLDDGLVYEVNELSIETMHSISQQIKLEAYSDCALVYNTLGSAKHPKLILHIPSLYESGCDHSPHFVMMAVIANMILDKDPDFEALISREGQPIHRGV